MSSESSGVTGFLSWRYAPGRLLALDRPRVLAVVNVTPDSFSDGGRLSTPDAACAAAVRAIADGALGVDVGGESTRPGAESVPAPEQIRRVVPAIRAIRKELGPEPLITVDTTNAKVAQAALDAGADAVNDVSAATDDPHMLSLVASRACGLILMHRVRAPATDVYSHAHPREPVFDGGVVAAVREALAEHTVRAQHAGIARDAIVVDPGLGFGKSVAQNLALIRGTPAIAALGYPVLSGISRKSFTARAADIAIERAPIERAFATVGLSVLHLTTGARLFRVHDVRAHVDALRAAWSAVVPAPD